MVQTWSCRNWYKVGPPQLSSLMGSLQPVVIITGYPDSDLMNKALGYGPLTVMKKPFTVSDIIAVVKSFLGIV